MVETQTDLSDLLDELVDKAGPEAAEAILREAIADLEPEILRPLDSLRPGGRLR